MCSTHLSSLPLLVGFASVLCSSGLLDLTAIEFSYSSEALSTLTQSSRALCTKPPSEDTLIWENAISESGSVTHSPKCHELAEWKDIFIDVSYICRGDFAGIGMMGVFFFSHSLLPE